MAGFALDARPTYTRHLRAAVAGNKSWENLSRPLD